MALWGRMLLAVVVMLMPGGFVFLVAYLLGRTVVEQYHAAQAAAHGGEVSLRQVLATVHVRDVVQRARATL